MATSPTALTKKLLIARGYHPWIVEHWNSFVHVRQDAYGVMDLIAFNNTSIGVLAVQSTSYSNMSSRYNKVSEWELLPVWLSAGNSFEIQGWKKKKNRWQCRLISIAWDPYEQKVWQKDIRFATPTGFISEVEAAADPKLTLKETNS